MVAEAIKSSKQQTEAMANVPKELLDAYEQASRDWLARVKSEVDLWSQLAAKLSATRSAPEAMQAYQEYMAQRMQMAAEDGRRLADDCQKMMSKIGMPFSNGWPKGSS
jgi:Phasin protein